MATHLAKLFGTEEDKVNCPFFYKMGACRHGAACDRKHHHPTSSPTIMLPHLYQNPLAALYAKSGGTTSVSKDEEAAIAREFEQTFIDIFDEVSRFGEVDELQVCDNLNDHLVSWARRGSARTVAPAAHPCSTPPPPASPPPCPSPPCRWAMCT